MGVKWLRGPLDDNLILRDRLINSLKWYKINIIANDELYLDDMLQVA